MQLAQVGRFVIVVLNLFAFEMWKKKTLQFMADQWWKAVVEQMLLLLYEWSQLVWYENV